MSGGSDEAVMELRRAFRSKLVDGIGGVVSLTVLVVVIFYSSQIRQQQIAPFHIDPYYWQVTWIDSECAANENCVRMGDHIKKIGSVEYEIAKNKRTIPFFKDFQAGEPVLIEFERGGEILQSWISPSRRKTGRSYWLTGGFVPLLFWLAATSAMVFLQPRDGRWRVLVLFCFVTALWTAAGFVAFSRVAYSSIVYHFFAWLFVPLAIHLHLILPASPIERHHRFLLPPLYVAAVVLALLDISGLHSRHFLLWGLALAVLVSLGLLFYRLFEPAPPAAKLVHRLMLFGVLLGLGPLLVFILSMIYTWLGGRYPFEETGIFRLFMLLMPIWPLTYIYAIYKHDLGRLEYRANRLLGAYGFLSLYVTLYAVTYVLITPENAKSETGNAFSFVLSLIFVAAAPPFRERFQRFVDRHVFGIRYTPNEVIGVFARRIPTAYSRPILQRVITGEILPTLLVRQSALYIFGDGEVETLYEEALPEDFTGVDLELLDQLLDRAGSYLPSDSLPGPRSWVRLVVPLSIQDKAIGVWLLGRRDPDDYYPRDDIDLLANLANQIAPVIENFRLVERARAEVAENRRLQRQLVHAQKMEAIGRFAAGIAHDFNNLLSVILGYSSLLVDRFKSDPDAHEGLSEIYDAGTRAAGLTRQLLAFSRQGKAEVKIVNLNEVVGEMSRMLRRMTGEDVEFKTILSPDLPNVRVDPGQMSQVVMNLAVNARDAMPDGGQLTIDTGVCEIGEDDPPLEPEIAPGRWVRMRVTDTGTGLDPEIRAHIFEPFFTTKEMGRGTGLGLSMVYGFIDQSGGHIFAESELGSGTVFSIFLPGVNERRAVSAEGDEERPLPAFRPSNETILLVEDEASVRAVTCEILEAQGYRVLQAESGAAGIELAELHGDEIDLLLTDVVMPQMKGPELARELMNQRPSLKVLYMSGYNEERLEPPAGQEEPILLQKPFSPQRLARLVRRVLDDRVELASRGGI